MALILGALLGFSATGSYLAFKKQQNGTSQKILVTPTPSDVTASETEQPTPTPIPEQPKLKIISPENESISNTSKIELKISTVPKSFLIISTPQKDYNLKVDNTGFTNQTIDLEPGVNIIKLSAIDPDLNQWQQELILTYSTASL